MVQFAGFPVKLRLSVSPAHLVWRSVVLSHLRLGSQLHLTDEVVTAASESQMKERSAEGHLHSARVMSRTNPPSARTITLGSVPRYGNMFNSKRDEPRYGRGATVFPFSAGLQPPPPKTHKPAPMGPVGIK